MTRSEQNNYRDAGHLLRAAIRTLQAAGVEVHRAILDQAAACEQMVLLGRASEDRTKPSLLVVRA